MLYQATINAYGIDFRAFWSINQAFMIAESLLAGLLTQSERPELAIPGAVLGIIVTFFWLASIARSMKWNDFRVAQARALEQCNLNGVMTGGHLIEGAASAVTHHRSLLPHNDPRRAVPPFRGIERIGIKRGAAALAVTFSAIFISYLAMQIAALL